MRPHRPAFIARSQLLTVFVIVLFAVSAVPVLADPSPSEPGTLLYAEENLPDGADVAEGLREAEETEEEERERRERPAAEAEREESRTAYGDLPASESEALLESQFGEQLTLLEQDPARRLTRSKLEQVFGPTEARVEVEGKTMLLDGTLPVRTRDEEGDLSKVSLSLQREEGDFAPVNPIVPVDLPEDASEGISIGESGLALTPETNASAGDARRLGGSDLIFYPEVEDDTDLLAAPVADGVELFSQLRSRESPQELRFEVQLPSGAQLQPDGEGGATVTLDGESIARIPSPHATDAQGADVPTSMTVEGRELVVEVAHRDMDVAYPILVDPSLFDDAYYHTWYAGYNLQELNTCPSGAWSGNTNNASRFYLSTSPIFESPGGSNRGLFVSAASTGGSQPANQFAQMAYCTPGSTTYINTASFVYLWQYNHGCAPNKYPEPHDYTGLWNNSTGWVSFYKDPAIISESAWMPGSASAQTAIMGLGTGNGAGSIPCWRDLYAGGAGIWLEDPEPPTWISAPSALDQWTDTSSAPISTGTASDPGVGMKYFNVYTTGSSGQASTLIGNVERACTGLPVSPCGASWSSQITNYNPAALPNGVNWLTVFAYDALGIEHNSQGMPIHVSVDHSAPEITLSGDLFSEEHKTYKGLITATDGSSASFATAQSGMKSVQFYFDGQLVGRYPETATPPACSNVQQGINMGSCKFEVPVELNRALSGEHTFRVVATDSLNHTAEKTVSLTLPKDENRPTLSVSGSLWSASGLWTSAGIASATLEAQDSTTGVVEESIYIDGTRVGSPITQECFSGGCSLKHTFVIGLGSYAEGAHTVKAVAVDAAGNKTETNWTVKLDKTLPTLNSVTAPEVPQGWTPQLSSFTLNYSASDEGSGIKKIEILRPSNSGTTLVNTPFNSSCTGSSSSPCPSSTSGSTVLSTAGMAQGTDTVTVKAYDVSGRISNARTVTILIDRSAPTIASATGPLVSASSSTLMGLVSKLGLTVRDFGSGLSSIQLKLDGELIAEQSYEEIVEAGGVQGCKGEICELNYSMEPVVGATFEPGLHHFELIAKDWTDKSASLAHDVVIDTNSPSVHLSGPLYEAAGKELEGTTATLEADVGDGSGEFSSGVASLEFLVDGTPVTSQEPGVFIYNEGVWGNGPHTVSVRATDGVGNIDIEQVHVNEPLNVVAPECPAAEVKTLSGGQVVSNSTAIAGIESVTPAALWPSEPYVSESESEGESVLDPAVTRTPQGLSLDELGIDVSESLMGGGIEEESSGAFTVGQAICMQPLQTSVAASEPLVVENSAVVYPNAAPDTDTVVRPTATGTAVVEHLRGETAPTQFSWAISLEQDEKLVELKGGRIAVVKSGGNDLISEEIPTTPPMGPATLDDTAAQIAQSEYELAVANEEVQGEVVTVVAAPELVTTGGEIVPGILRIAAPQVITAELPANDVAETEAMIIRANPAAEPEDICAAVAATDPQAASGACEIEEEEPEGEDEGNPLGLFDLATTSDPELNATISSAITKFETLAYPSGASASSGSSATVTEQQKRFCEHGRVAECRAFNLDGLEAAVAEERLFNIPSDGTVANAFRHSFWVALMHGDEIKYEDGIAYSLAHEEDQWKSHRGSIRNGSRMDILNDWVGWLRAKAKKRESCELMLYKSVVQDIFLGAKRDPFAWARSRDYQYYNPVFRKLKDNIGPNATGDPVYPNGKKCKEIGY